MIHKNDKTMKVNGLINRLEIKGKKVKKGACACSKTILASNINTSLNATENSKFLFCSQVKSILLMKTFQSLQGNFQASIL